MFEGHNLHQKLSFFEVPMKNKEFVHQYEDLNLIKRKYWL